jgi:hypothetical protein
MELHGMKTENRYYDVTPRLLPADTEAEVTIRPLHDHCRFAAGKPYAIQHHLMDGSPVAPGSALAGTYTVKPDRAGRLRFRSRFAGEQEHWVRVTPPAAQGAPAIDFRLFSLQPDLFARRPFRGDLHIHSNRSDGKESPAYVAAACRRTGLDFMAVTDHHRHAPSLEAAAAFAAIATDLRIFPGEEVHPPGVPVHMVNFAGRVSVNALFKTARYQREVRRIVAEIDATCGSTVDPYQAAACVWSCRKAREGGGLAIYCHPHWVSGCAYNVTESLNEWMFQHHPFDAFELIGGYHRHELDSNHLQVAWYHDQRAKGYGTPVVGSSDAHGCERGELFGWYYTLVFSRSVDDLLESVRQGYSVAVEEVPGDIVRPHGPYRLVKYALFLAREILPLHDELCVEEGRLMLEHAAGDPQAGPDLARLNGRCARLYERLWNAAGQPSA